jgi:toxin ParE1/3/4
VTRLIATAAKAAGAPRAGRRVPESAHDDVREVFLRAYRIVYRALEDGVAILTIFEGHRRFPDDAE